MKRKISFIVLLALSALLCSCNDPSSSAAESSALTESSVSEPADCCGGDVPDCCKDKDESKADCCTENKESKADCCREKEESDCCKEESKSDCCRHSES